MTYFAKHLKLLIGILLFLLVIECVKYPFIKKNSSSPPTATSTKWTTPNTSNAPDYRNFFGISWRGNVHENLTYARQMKYDYVFYMSGMEKDTLSNGLHFYLESPEYSTYSSYIDVNTTYKPTQVSFWENNCVLKNNTDPFPNNIATGWFDSSTNFRPILDFQQQKVIIFCIDSITKIIKKVESVNPKFHFGGLAWDVPNPGGDFWSAPSGQQVTLSYWTGGDFGATNASVTHDFSTYTDGHLAFYKQLFSTLRQSWPGARFIMEPWNIYNDWISKVQNRSDVNQVMPDILSEESPGTDFVDDSRIFSGGLLTKGQVSSTTPNVSDDQDNRTIAAKAAINGATFGWFGRFGGTGDMPNYQSIAAVPSKLKLIRILSNYENLNNTELAQRTWDGTTYKSPTAFADPNAIGVLQPGTSKYFLVFMTSDGQVTLPAGKTIISISKTNSLLVESGDGSADLIVLNGVVKLNGSAGLNNVYIIKLN